MPLQGHRRVMVGRWPARRARMDGMHQRANGQRGGRAAGRHGHGPGRDAGTARAQPRKDVRIGAAGRRRIEPVRFLMAAGDTQSRQETRENRASQAAAECAPIALLHAPSMARRVVRGSLDGSFPRLPARPNPGRGDRKIIAAGRRTGQLAASPQCEPGPHFAQWRRAWGRAGALEDQLRARFQHVGIHPHAAAGTRGLHIVGLELQVLA